jgi:hypothetical protein
MLLMISDAKLTEFTRAGMSTMLNKAKNVPMLNTFGGENWTPSLNHPESFNGRAPITGPYGAGTPTQWHRTDSRATSYRHEDQRRPCAARIPAWCSQAIPAVTQAIRVPAKSEGAIGRAIRSDSQT